jgi:hypothetical protein
MAGSNRLVETGELKTNRLAQIAAGISSSAVSISYDHDFDALVLLAFEPDSDLIAHYVAENVALLYDEHSMEIAGVQVENFEHSFVPKHNELQITWTLSDALGQKFDNLGDLMLAVERRKPEIAREVIRAAKSIPQELAAVFAA